MSIAEKLTTIAENQQKVYDAGAKSEYDRFWDDVQLNGTRRMYANGFCMNSWTKETFKPKYDMKPTQAQYMFAYWGAGGRSNSVEAFDLRDVEVTIDFSESTSVMALFNGNGMITGVGVIDTSSAQDLGTAFYGASALVTIEKLVLKEDGSQTFSNTFTACGKLANLTVEGVIGNTLSLSSCTKLTHDSLMSIIGALKDFVAEGAGTTRTLTLGTTNLNKLTDAEKQSARDKGWTLV